LLFFTAFGALLTNLGATALLTVAGMHNYPAATPWRSSTPALAAP
jgi:hypothetical protein